MTRVGQGGALERIAALAARGAHPLAVLDIDLTLVDNAERTRSLLADFVTTRLELAAGVREALAERVQTLVLRFSIRENVAALGLDEAAQKDALRFWWTAFFEPARLIHDTPLPGAVAATRALVDAGATLVYLTARPSLLAAATIETMRAMGFLMAAPGTVLVTKPDPAERDEAFKTRALAWIGRLGEVALCADNEPAHCNAMHDAFVDALTVHVATRHSEPAPPLRPAVVVVPGLTEAL